MSQADIQNSLGPDAQRLAQENTSAGLSTTARLDDANTKAIRQIMQGLNKRGLLHSGEAGYQLDQENLGYRQAQSDAYQKFLGYLQQYQQGYLSAQQQRDQTLAQSYSDAADRQLALNQSVPAAAPEAPAAPAAPADPAAGNTYDPTAGFTPAQQNVYRELNPSGPVNQATLPAALAAARAALAGLSGKRTLPHGI
jgi:hypothetical protein